jgi:hypothetical protein
MNEESSPIKPLVVVPIAPPPQEERVRRGADFTGEGERASRYTLPRRLKTASPVGYRTRVALSADEAREAMGLLALVPPTRFVAPEAITDQALFEEIALGVLSSRQSTNSRGQRQVSFGPEESAEIATLLRRMDHLGAEVLDHASMTHIVLSRPYRTPFTMLLTLVGHKTLLNLVTVPARILRKRLFHEADIPSIGCLQHLHLGILAEAMERAAVLASAGKRKAQVLVKPFAGSARRDNREVIRALARRAGLGRLAQANGWQVSMVAQVGVVPVDEAVAIRPETARKVGANLLAFRSERIQPGVNQEEKAPAVYQERQSMRIPDELVVQAGRAAYNAFARWTGTSREGAKELLLLERVDVLTPGGKERLRAMRRDQNTVTDRLIRDMPLWADLPTGRVFSRNANRGRKAFSLAGQRIYVGGLDREAVDRAGLDWLLAVRAVGSASARSALYCEIMGVVDLPADCDLLAGICMMAGPVNQNDVGKQFYGMPDLLAQTGASDPTSLLVWTLKGKTIADPIGNEEQLMNAARKGALVDLRPGPHDAVLLSTGGGLRPMRLAGGGHSQERGFADVGNFVTSPSGASIEGNEGVAWPEELRSAAVWPLRS